MAKALKDCVFSAEMAKKLPITQNVISTRYHAKQLTFYQLDHLSPTCSGLEELCFLFQTNKMSKQQILLFFFNLIMSDQKNLQVNRSYLMKSDVKTSLSSRISACLFMRNNYTRHTNFRQPRQSLYKDGCDFRNIIRPLSNVITYGKFNRS